MITFPKRLCFLGRHGVKSIWSSFQQSTPSLVYGSGFRNIYHNNSIVPQKFMDLSVCVFFNAFFQVPIYWVAQLAGSISASFTLSVLLHPIKHVGTTSPSGSDFQALIAEIVMTFSMMFIASAVATDTKAVRIPSPYFLLYFVMNFQLFNLKFSFKKKNR